MKALCLFNLAPFFKYFTEYLSADGGQCLDWKKYNAYKWFQKTEAENL